MADNFTANPGAGGATFASDEVGGVQVPRVKLQHGVDGSAVDASASDPLPVSMALPPDAATETTLQDILANLPPPLTGVPDNEAAASPIRLVGQQVWNCSFSEVGASVLAQQFNAPIVGTGVTYSQGSGALALVSGTNTNAEFLARSAQSWRGSLRMRFSTVLSQRIANQNFAVILGDLVGEGLSCTINSATSISVTKTAHGFTSQNVGQFMFVGGIAGANGVPGRYAIASIPNANTINFTVAGWPASGSCTLTLFGHSHVKTLFQGTTATQAAWDAQRRGWASGDTTITINTTANPGTIIQNDLDGRQCYVADTLRASSAASNVTARGSRVENIPDDNLDLYTFIWLYNGSTAPASTTTWTISFMAVEKFANTPVYVQGFRAVGGQNPVPVVQQGNVTINLIPAGANAIGDVGQQYRANATGAGSVANINCPATPAVQTIKGSAGRLIGIYLVNTNATIRWLKVFNIVSPTLASSSATLRIPLPQNQPVYIAFEGGIGFATAITCAVCSTGSLTDATGAVTLDDVTGFAVFA